MTDNTTFHVKLNSPATEDGLKEAMEAAGMNPHTVRAISPIHDGYALTELIAQGIWEHETGHAYCRERCKGKCPGDPKHLAWNELSEGQQETFIKRYVRFLENCREEELLTDVLMTEAEEFDDVALSVASHEY